MPLLWYSCLAPVDGSCSGDILPRRVSQSMKLREITGEGNDKRLTGSTRLVTSTPSSTASPIGASTRIPREAETNGKGYREDRRLAANCDPYKATARIMKTTSPCLMP